MRGLKRLRSARVISAGHAFVQNLHHTQNGAEPAAAPESAPTIGTDPRSPTGGGIFPVSASIWLFGAMVGVSEVSKVGGCRLPVTRGNRSVLAWSSGGGGKLGAGRHTVGSVGGRIG
jgi:hypothetical protein